MAGGTSDGDEEMISGVNATPLVDITLVLLVIFMVTATCVVRRPIEVELPRAAAGGETVGTTLTFVLDRQGDLYVDGEKASMDDARAAVKKALAVDKDAKAIISADKAISHGAV